MIVFSLFVFFIVCLSVDRFRGVFSLVATLYVLLSALYVVSDMLTGVGFNDSVVYHIYSGIKGAGLSEYKKEVFSSLGFLSVVGLILYVGFWDFKFLAHCRGRIGAKISSLIVLSLFVFSPWSENYSSQGYKFISSYLSSQNVSSEYVLNKNDIKRKKNVVIIYAESFERTYQDQGLFPGLISNLEPIIRDGVEFTNIDNDGGGWTIAGLVNSQCGLPLTVPNGQGNNMGAISLFMPSAYCLGDLLKDNGYDLQFIGGAKSEFAGKGTFLAQHGFKSTDLDFFVNRIPVDQSNYSDWGVHDDHLLDYAYDKFTSLSKGKKPFVLSVLTLDTHHPSGHIPLSCANDKSYGSGDMPILNAVKCSDKLISKFIKKIQLSDAYKDTLIVLQSDHLAMPNDAYPILTSQPEKRKNTFVILGRDIRPAKIERPGLLIDVGATILSYLGNDEGLGFGRSLLEDYHSGMSYAKFKQADRNMVAYSKFAKNTWSLSTFAYGAKIKENKIFLDGDVAYSLPALFVLGKNLDVEDVYFDDLNGHVASLNNNDSYVLVDSCQTQRVNADGNCFIFGSKGSSRVVRDFDKELSVRNGFFKNL